MNKDTVIKHYEHTLEWVLSLADVTDEEWRSAIADGKWSIAEIIAHFVPWDEFILHDRLKEFWNDRAIYCYQNRIASRNEENRSISLEYILFDRSNRADVIKLFSRFN
ncbi:MAG: DinB family protein [Bacillota bacterium]